MTNREARQYSGPMFRFWWWWYYKVLRRPEPKLYIGEWKFTGANTIKVLNPDNTVSTRYDAYKKK